MIRSQQIPATSVAGEGRVALERGPARSTFDGYIRGVHPTGGRRTPIRLRARPKTGAGPAVASAVRSEPLVRRLRRGHPIESASKGRSRISSAAGRQSVLNHISRYEMSGGVSNGGDPRENSGVYFRDGPSGPDLFAIGSRRPGSASLGSDRRVKTPLHLPGNQRSVSAPRSPYGSVR